MTRSRQLLITAACALAALAVASPRAEARRHGWGRHGGYVYPAGAVLLAPGDWYAGAGVIGTRIVDQTGGPEQIRSGAGLSLWLGLRVSERLSLELGWLGSFHNPTDAYTAEGGATDFLVLQGVTADARIHLNRSGALDPYVQGGVGFYALGRESLGVDSSGTGFQLGAGFDVWLGSAVTVGLRARYHGIAMGPPSGAENDTFISALTVEGSLALHF